MTQIKKQLDYLFSLNEFKINYFFKDTIKLIKILNNPQNDFKSIHISGTNGKTSVSKFISNILIEAGYKVGTYTSPHMEKFNDRFLINGKMITDKKLSFYIKSLKKIFKENNLTPSFFEFKTALCFKYFSDEKIDIGIIEVGVGGKKDSTNVLDNKILSIISNVSLDHQKFLGETKKEIAIHKIGIVKNKIDLITMEEDKNILKIFKNHCDKNNSKIFNYKNYKIENLKTTSNFQSFFYKKRNLKVNLKLLGKYQIKNSILSIESIYYLIEKLNYKITKKNISDGLKITKNYCRFEIIQKKPLLIIDGSHNLGGLKELENDLKLFKQNKKYLIISLKEIEKIKFESLKRIICKFENIIISKPLFFDFECEIVKNEMKKFYKKNIIIEKNYSKIKKLVFSNSNKNDLILISGSLYLATDIRDTFIKK